MPISRHTRKPGTYNIPCGHCHGTGYIIQAQIVERSIQNVKRVCSQCKGAKYVRVNTKQSKS